MRLWIHEARKDHKYPVTYGFDNGIRIKKILTIEQISIEVKKAEFVDYPSYDFRIKQIMSISNV